MTKIKNIRNFAIVSHIDHGKSTLADRMMEKTDTMPRGKIKQRFLDSHPIEQERGITIKLAPVRMNYEFENQKYIFNLIDTPGHVDFSYEVSRSLKACEGAILMVDAQAGIQAQTMANAQLAMESNLEILPVVNKIDLETADPQEVALDLAETFGFNIDEILFISAKTGQNLDQLFEAIVKKFPKPEDKTKDPLKALVFNSFYHPHQGVVAFVRVFSGKLDKDTLKEGLIFWGTETDFDPLEIGIFSPDLRSKDELISGEVGYVATGLKDMSKCQVGDTLTSLTSFEKRLVKPLPGYQPPKPMVFLDFYPSDNQDFPDLKDALERLKLTDASLTFKPVSSVTLGPGFRVGFLGILHADIVQERLERDYDLDVVATSPSVEFRVKIDSSEGQKVITIQSATELPDRSKVEEILEPVVTATIFTPMDYFGNIMQLCQDSRGELVKQEFFGQKVKLIYYLPLAELLSGFYDRLKSLSSGFASLDWEFFKYQPFDAQLIKVYLNKDSVDSLSFLVPKDRAYPFSRDLAQRLKKTIPRQQFEVRIQVGIGSKIIASERIAPFRKDVTAKLYGGDQTRKDKLLKKQKKGKKRLKAVGNITLSQDALQAVLGRD